MHVGILGGGALGLTVAYRLLQSGVQVTVLEKESVVGGLAASFEVGGAHLERFYHHLFRSDRVITGLIDELGLGSKLLWIRPNTSVLSGGQLHQLDSPVTALLFKPLAPIDRVRQAAALAYLRLEPNYHRLESTTADAWLRRWMGDKAYDVVWKPQLQSKFGEHYSSIAMSWMWARIHLRSTSLGYMRGGFYQLYAALEQRIRALGGEIQTERTVERIASTGGGVEVRVNSEARRFDRVVCTLPTRLFVRLAQGLPSSYQTCYDWGEHFGAHCVVLALDRPLTKAYWVSVNERGYPFMALVEHGNFMPVSDYGGRHLVYLGTYAPMDDRRFTLSDAELLDWYLPYLRAFNPAFDRSWVTEHYVFKAPYAQPIVTVDYHQHIPPHETPLPNVFLANMFQVYPQDRGQNYSIEMAENVAVRVLGGTSP